MARVEVRLFKPFNSASESSIDETSYSVNRDWISKTNGRLLLQMAAGLIKNSQCK